ncbi:hypothetical protein G7Y89_g14382 [Cudoniella acicularis]|uniref:WSC domain-containing protein n=1 Tax=Cudoniella acicularis TaxID=354080 RepID=A0A8H4R3Y4_9HELO|nr:hypothetical protein G7Y89_g14382 [Cudoniella acicularis]
MHFTKATFLAAFASTSSAYSATGRTFAVNHFYGKGPLTQGRMDPIISPGVASGHVHAIQGGNAFALSMTDDQALGSTCTSSLVKNDKSNYWTPSLYFKDPQTGSLESVDMFYMNVYYFFEATTDKIEAFQPGHRMVIGNPELRSPPATGGKSILDLNDGTPQPVQWTCPRSNTNSPLYPVNSDGLHGAGIQDPGNAGAGVGFPDQNCDGYASPLRADIHFPSCYNPAAGLDNYKENMQFPTNGNCPTGWVHTPHLFYEVYWNTPVFASRWTQGQGTQPFVLSNGDPTGYGLHADFIAGWDVDTLQQVIDNCNAGDSGMDKCPGLIGGLNDPSTSCNIASPIQETIFGTMSALPGNNPIGQWGVAPAGAPAASNASGPVATSTAAPAVSSATSAVGKVASTPVADPVSASSVPVLSQAASSQAAVPTTLAVSSTAPIASSTGSSPAAGTTPVTVPVASGGDSVATTWASYTTLVYTTVTNSGSVAAPTSTGTSSSTVAAGWSSLGCYQDVANNRVMTGIELANIGNHQVTNTKCVAYCAKAGYSMAGTEFGGQCFCANSLRVTTKLDDSKCNMPCEGDSTQICGGGATLSVYSMGESTSRRSMRIRGSRL